MKGNVDLGAILASLPEQLERNILRGAMRAGAEVIADGARENCRSAEVRETIGTTSRAEPGLVTAKVQTKGKGAYKAPWLENGTEPHFVSVDSEQSGGRTVRRVNRSEKAGSLDIGGARRVNVGEKGSIVINGQFVGDTVHHPGARPYPFMRPALDAKERDAVAAIGSYIGKRLTKEGLAAPAPTEEADE